MEIQYHLHIKDRNGVTFIAIINPVPNIILPNIVNLCNKGVELFV